MTGPTIVLAVACVAIGLLPVVVVPAAVHVGALIVGAPFATTGDTSATTLSLYMIAIACGLLIVWSFSSRREASVGTWSCGFAHPTARMEYTSSSFAAPLIAAFRVVAGVRTHRTDDAFATRAADPVLDDLALPAWAGVRMAARWLRPIQQGRLSRSILYVVAAVLGVLFYLVIAGRAT
jgi:hypothetical protein